MGKNKNIYFLVCSKKKSFIVEFEFPALSHMGV